MNREAVIYIKKLIRDNLSCIISAALFFAGLYLTSLYNYALFHSLAEIVTNIIAFGIFGFAWHSRKFSDNDYFQFLGISYLSVAAVDLIHTLSYKGIGVFIGYDANLPTQFWIAARYIQSLSLLAAPFFLRRKLNAGVAFTGYIAVTGILFAVIFYGGIFPDCFIEGRGLTPFKIVSEYIIILILAASIVLLYRNKEKFQPNVFRRLIGSILLTILSELAFTSYISVYGLSNLIGHLLKISAFYFMYLAIIKTGLEDPYSLIFRDQKQKEDLLERLVDSRTFELKKSEERYRRLIETMNDGLAVIDETGNFTFVNDRFCDMLGYARDEIVGNNIFNPSFTLLDDEMRGMVKAQIERRKRGESASYEMAWTKKNGEKLYTIISPSPILESGVFKGSFAVITDITPLMTAYNELSESEGRLVDTQRILIEKTLYLDNILNSSFAVAIAATDIDFRIKYYNPMAEKIFGYKAEDVIGKTVMEMHIKEKVEPARFERAIEKVRNEGMYENTVELRTDGEVRFIESRVSGIWDENRQLIGFVLMSQDVTERKRLESHLYHAQKMESIGQLASGVAHDFNNIITAIMAFANLLKMKLPANDKTRMYVDEMLSASEKAAELTQNLLAFGRKQILNPKPVDINAVLSMSEKLLSRLVREDIMFSIRLADGDLIIMADAGQMEQVLMNMATNARDAMPEGGILTVEIERVEIDDEFIKAHGYGEIGGYAILSISDTGIGMDEKAKERIFEPFFTTKGVGEGTGLGLAMVYGIIKQHNGYINVYSEPGKGTTFKIYLPLYVPVFRGQDAYNAQRKEDFIAGHGAGETILLADDNAELRRGTKAILEEFGYMVIEAADGEDAVEIFKRNKDLIKLLILDVAMPRKNGREAFEEIKNIRPGVKAVFTSGYTADIIHKNGMLDESLDFMPKPVSPIKLLRKVREVLDR